MISSPYALAVCQPGMERWLKAELAHLRPDLRPGFQRPGLVTFVTGDAPFAPTEAPPAIFARMWACSAGPRPDVPAILAEAERVGATRLWLGPRDQGVPGEVPPAKEEAAREDARAWAERLAPAFRSGDPEPGEGVLDVITSPGEPPIVGWHVHGFTRHPGPVGRFPHPSPDDLPSRAWARVVEGLAWSHAPLRPGDHVLEIGAAPGGGTRAFVEAGARVYAVDPHPLDPAVLALPGVRQVARAIGDVPLAELPDDIAWIACDAGIRPADVVGALGRLLPRWPTRPGLLLTLKLVDEPTLRHLGRTLERLAALGPYEIRARQLPANRRDIFVHGRPAGARTGKGRR